LINSGMAPMKPYFQGTEEPPRRRVTTCQKCIRTPDLENVGKTARHGTYFEMLGNFSFGDYFKNEAIPWAWEFLTKTLEIPAELLWPSVYEKDDEAYALWRDVIGVPEERIVKLGKADNFWEHGSGPCGPCSEIYFDRGEKYGCGSPDCKPGCECDRYMEIWNNVFSQFDNDGNGNYTELSQKNIDTGMGLERLACVMQGVDNLFEVDTVRKILDTVCSYAGKEYGKEYKDDVSIRIITDHIRSTSFMICDGVLPSNEGRGYVLRRLIRRACRNGRLLGINRAFLSDLCEVVIGENEGAYPELREKADYIKKILSIEEANFDKTIDKGLELLSDNIAKLEAEGKKELPGADLFKLYDTYGFPADLVIEILEEKGFTANTDEFKACMDEQKRTARERMRDNGGWKKENLDILGDIAKTEFDYANTEITAKAIAIVVDGELVDAVSEGEFTVILDKTVFYGEGGGQVGDSGVITFDGGSAKVVDTKKIDGRYMHVCALENGILKVGTEVKAAIDVARREAIRRNHSSVHLLQAALRTVLGSHVEQAGSYVDEFVARFDFNHFEAMSAEQIAKVEALVNSYILAGAEIETVETDIETAKAMGAMALFGEKYGDKVRVVKMGEFSTELCGGTHMTNTAKAGLYKITSESSVAAGVRRIEAVTGENFIKYVNAEKALIENTARALKIQNANEISTKAESAMAEIKELKNKIEAMNTEMASLKLGGLEANAKEIGAFKVILAELSGMGANELRAAGDILKDKYANVIAVLASAVDGKVALVAVCGKDAVKNGANAGKFIKTAATICGGGGGGRPDSATAGGKDASKIAEALAAVEKEIG
ncbi:MAG: alanine--tRNA ligase, partial [Clostridia bacterium]|nr:alanine--tRNA ligase [Clostridia bacterium]